MKVRILVGAHAYAVIEQEGRTTNILLSPGKGAPASLRDSAADYTAEAERKLGLAVLCRQAANVLEVPSEQSDAQPTPFDPFPMSEIQVEAALCLWEAALEMRDAHTFPEPTPENRQERELRYALDNAFNMHGTSVMRHVVMQLAPACDRAWCALSEDEQEASAPYDWEFVPAFLRACIADGRMQTAIDNQYAKDPIAIL